MVLESGAVVELELDTGKVIRTLEVQALAVLSAAHALWITSFDRGNLLRVEP